jgi:endonuclease/exonuclease/phosphatase family metal-dependent hydrolase
MSQNVTMQFNILQYNVFARPHLVGHEGQQERLQRIPQVLSQINNGKVDVIALCEVFSQVGEPLCDMMLSEFKKYGFLYHTRVISGNALEKVGGTMIVSKWPLHPLDGDTHVYRNMPTIDSDKFEAGLAEKVVAKGVSYAAVNKTENGLTKTFHVFATHLHAWNTEVAVGARRQQANQMKEFLEKKNIPNNEPVIFAGDFNVDLVRCVSEFENLSQILDAKLPEMIGEQKYTSDPSSNLLVGKDSAADRCQEQYKNSWGEKSVIKSHFFGAVKDYLFHPAPEYKNPDPTSQKIPGLNPFFADLTKGSDTLYIESDGCYCPCCPHEWLDYILFSKKHQQPSDTPTLECIRMKATSPFEATWSEMPAALAGVPDKIILSDLSDHYPVLGRFLFPA